MQERASIEDTYVKALNKLHQRVGREVLPSSSDSASTTAGWAALKASLDEELINIIRIHDVFSQRINDSVVAGFRESARNGDARLKQSETGVVSCVKDFEDASSRLGRAQSKSGSLNRSGKGNDKLMAAQNDLNTAHASWVASAPSYLKTAQQVDKARLEGIKENLAKYQTMQNDLGRERMELAERGLNAVFAWEIEEDMQAFVNVEGGRKAMQVDGMENDVSAPSRSRAGEFGQTSASDGRPSIQVSTPAQSTEIPRQSRDVEPAPSIHSVQSSSRGGGSSSFFSKMKPSLNRKRSSSHPNAYGNLENPPPSFQQQSNNQSLTPNARHANRNLVGSGTTASDDASVSDLGREDETEALAAPPTASNGAAYSSSTPTKSKRDSFIPSLMRRRSTATKESASNFLDNRAQNSPAANSSGRRLSSANDNPVPASIVPTRQGSSLAVPSSPIDSTHGEYSSSGQPPASTNPFASMQGSNATANSTGSPFGNEVRLRIQIITAILIRV